MPANYAHHRFGREVVKAMPAEARQCITRFRRMYDLGLHGPDIFFFYNPYWKTAVGDLGNQFHTMTGRDFFPAACRAANSEAARAYLYGLLAHYCLDSACHPFVNRLHSIGEAKHAVLESEFDRFLLVQDGEPEPEHYDIGKKLHLTRGECMTVAEFYPGATGGNISRCVRSMAFSTKFLSSGNPARRKALLDKLKSGISDQMIPAKENEELTFYVSELKALYDEAVEAYPRLLDALSAHMASGAELGADFEANFG